MTNLDDLRAAARASIAQARTLAELEALETEYLGRRGGKVSELMRAIGTLPPEERPAFGQRVNALRDDLVVLLRQRREELARLETTRRLQTEQIDVTLPGRVPARGHPHPLVQTFQRVREILTGLGFQEVDGPEVEEYQFNFAALNYPEEHPALDEQMSFYLTDTLLMRTQTTALQGRVMPALTPPFRIFTLGRCFRYDPVDATHSHTFHQVDVFIVDRVVSLADLKGTLVTFAREMFGPETEVRFRPDFFPFVEPGAEIAIRRGEGWLELGGAGMIHPNVLARVGIDPEEWTGFAFGLGMDRMPMRRYGIEDIRLLFENDLRMLRQF
ncbi:MAG: phenylalanine--tRNA ligase subunit alpha [Armatimonadetes bacterium]|nr:phenylalanine--tRNA ligase subunit alpha [Armatimonadota bacterium]